MAIPKSYQSIAAAAADRNRVAIWPIGFKRGVIRESKIHDSLLGAFAAPFSCPVYLNGAVTSPGAFPGHG